MGMRHWSLEKRASSTEGRVSNIESSTISSGDSGTKKSAQNTVAALASDYRGYVCDRRYPVADYGDKYIDGLAVNEQGIDASSCADSYSCSDADADADANPI
jgi:hypothetical protein